MSNPADVYPRPFKVLSQNGRPSTVARDMLLSVCLYR